MSEWEYPYREESEHQKREQGLVIAHPVVPVHVSPPGSGKVPHSAEQLMDSLRRAVFASI